LEGTYKRKAVAYWLLAGVIMIIIQTLLGGVTRLTGSGLSITEWKPIMGAIPPINEQEWSHAFNGYKQIGQYKYLNSDFTLSDFKFIFFWEWFHRLWARLLGLVFVVGFIYFLIKKYFDTKMIKPFIVLFILGGLQGLIGWVMVSTGLNTRNLSVDPVALAIHFISAMILACYTLWFALMLLVPDEKRETNKRLHNFTLVIVLLLFAQLTYGSFMAGREALAAKAASTWPTINGALIPDNMIGQSFVYNPINVQFVHRGLAYLLLTLLIFWFASGSSKANKNIASLLRQSRWWPFVFVFIQVTLGILTVISAPTIVPGHFARYQVLAETHQLVAMFLLMSLVVNLYVVRRQA
jgi:cytochrome c oxidase assembly protein subunit 15